jgi:KDO2-lipid IV(A) lauroyltransferase
MPPDERRELARRVFEHFGIVAVDFLRVKVRTPQEWDEMTHEGMEHLERALALGKGVIAITGHFGNWERLPTFLARRGIAGMVVARDSDDQEMTEFVNEFRAHGGWGVIPRGNSTRPILQALKSNQLVGILPDQNSSETFLPFFGHPCGTVLGPGVLAERSGAPVVPLWCVRVGPGRYHVIVEAPLEPTGPSGVRGEAMARAINLALEGIIRRYPEQWLWFHNRWKSARQRGLI